MKINYCCNSSEFAPMKIMKNRETGSGIIGTSGSWSLFPAGYTPRKEKEEKKSSFPIFNQSAVWHIIYTRCGKLFAKVKFHTKMFSLQTREAIITSKTCHVKGRLNQALYCKNGISQDRLGRRAHFGLKALPLCRVSNRLSSSPS